ncbi:hypothetical protein FNV43_RR21015 [Rhamnella rubrinervis]|uniref:DUF1985 domain-containing protein n=1 Tax=Rhamnella rubrinervis TaxID=2594499 RepID=A0A8K0E1V0_9ROSA|nr:hypothetical protein FNV43_RR21015 [Rhamnella rubrinervis]
MVKLCLLYFLECGILGKESQSTIKLDHFSMVEDLEYFNQYPWGLNSYNATMLSLHKVLSLRNGELNPSSTYSLCGFQLAFQEIEADKCGGREHYHSDHEGNVLDETNLQVNADDENPHHQFSVNEGDSEVQFVTPSKVPYCDPQLKKRSDKIKSPFIVTTGTQEELKNTLPPPDKFDPKRTVPTEITSKIFNYMTEGEDVYIDYGICEIKKEFFQTLITEAGWLVDEVK